MTTPHTRARSLTAVTILTALVGCGGKETALSSEEIAPSTFPDADAVALTETRGFFNPKKNEEWVYRVTREIPVSKHLSDRDALRVVTKHENHYELAFERKRVCAGPVTMENTESELLRIDIFEEGVLAEQEYYEINSQGLFGRGWSGEPGKAPTLSSTAIPIAVPGMEGGMMWRTTAEESTRQFKFRVIDRSTLELPAGSFEVAQIQITSGNARSSLKRTLWFAENVGIVKEISTHFHATGIRLRETSELISWNLPNGLKAAHHEGLPFETSPASTGPAPEEGPEDDL